MDGIDASVLSLGLLHRLRSACVSAVWSRKVRPAHTGAVLTLLDGVVGCDPGFVLFGVGFGCFAGTLPVGLLRFGEVVLSPRSGLCWLSLFRVLEFWGCLATW